MEISDPKIVLIIAIIFIIIAAITVLKLGWKIL